MVFNDVGDLYLTVRQPEPFELVLGEVFSCLKSDLYYAALHLALSIPDVCSSLETTPDSDDRFRVEKRYIGWCIKYLSPKFSIFDAADCWALRGGVLHNGDLTGHSKTKYDHVMFTLGGKFTIGEMLSENNGGTELSGLSLDIGIFCNRVADAAHDWMKDVQDNETVQINMENLVRLRPQGRPPHIVGMPVIS